MEKEKIIFKGYTFKGYLIKLEKFIGEQKVAECGIDQIKYFNEWGHEAELRKEYEDYVSKGNPMNYIELEVDPVQVKVIDSIIESVND